MRYSYKKALEKLTEYALGEGYRKVILNHKDSSHMLTKGGELHEPIAIYIQKDKTLEQKTYLFLHELGHHELRKNWARFRKKLPINAYAEEKSVLRGEVKYKRRNSYKVGSLEEEVLAWDEGLLLGKGFRLKINPEKWNALRSACLMSYIEYYATLRS